MADTTTSATIEPPIKFKLVNRDKKTIPEHPEHPEHLDSVSSGSSTQDGIEEVDVIELISSDQPISTLPESTTQATSLKELLINYIQTMPTLSWLPISVSILSLAVTPDNSIPSHILLHRTNGTTKIVKNGTTSTSAITGRKTLTDSLSAVFNRRYLKRSRSRCLLGVNTLKLCSESVIVTKPKEKLPKLLVVLDMDETLMHMHTNPQIHYDYTINLVEHSTSDDPMFINCNIHPTMYISKRPGVQEFLRYLSVNSDSYEIALFTAGTKAYADAVMEGLDPNCSIIPQQNRYYRGSCEFATIDPSILMDVSLLETKIEINGQPISFLQKDLNKLNWPLTRTVLLDNSLLSFSMHPENGVWIKSYHPETPLNENENRDCLLKLSEVIKLLETLKNVDDVRKHLSNQFNISKLLGKNNKIR